MHHTSTKFVTAVALATIALGPALAQAQDQRKPHPIRNVDGEVFDFAPDGAWRVQARRVAAYRRLLMAQGNYRALNAPMASPSTAPAAAALSGIRKIPAILFAFSDSARAPNFAAGAGDTSKYNQLLFSATAPTGFPYSTPYSIRSFYSQMSHTLLDLQGVVIGWDTLANPEATYTGGQNCSGANPYGYSNCNGIWNGTATTAMRTALTQAIAKYDGAVDFGQFDNDGPDGMPNSGDDDGYVDMAIFIHSELDGACASATNQHLWSHRSQLSYTTNDVSLKPSFGSIRFRDYTLQSGVGGAGGCTASQIMSIGTAGHESGHAFGLPDLYDTQQATEGIGNWGLMGSGNQATGSSPARMEAWSLSELGWITIVPLTRDTTVTFGPVKPAADTAFLIRVQGTNTRKEHFLVENRQGVLSDSALLRVACGRSGLLFPTTCHGGLAIWHVDSTKIQASKGVNQMNGGTGFHGLSLVQTDNRGDLEKTPGAGNRGDAGDLWPGYGTGAGKTRYSFDTSPAAIKNLDSTFVGFELSNISQSLTEGAVTFQLKFGAVTVVRAAADTTPKVKVDAATYGRFANLLADGSIHSISMDSAQVTPNGKTQFLWSAWSDAGARTHNITGKFTGDSISATFATKYQIKATAQGTGTIASLPSVDHTNGTFVDKNSAMTLTATATGGAVFDRWIGDTNSTSNPLVLSMTHGFNVTANFVGGLAQTSGAPPNPLMGKAYTFNLTASGGTGQYSWSQTGGTLPTGLSLGTDGSVTGIPAAAGPFTANVRVTSGSQTADGTVSFTVTEPTLVLANTLGGLLGTGGSLSADDKTYLDLIGNQNNMYDIGDFLAWVQKTGATPPPSPLLGVLPPPSPPEVWVPPVPDEDPR